MLTRIKNTKRWKRMGGLCILMPLRELLPFLLLLTTIISSLPVKAQDSRELEQERGASKKFKGAHPPHELVRTRMSALRPGLLGVHPRVYVTGQEPAPLRERARPT